MQDSKKISLLKQIGAAIVLSGSMVTFAAADELENLCLQVIQFPDQAKTDPIDVCKCMDKGLSSNQEARDIAIAKWRAGEPAPPGDVLDELQSCVDKHTKTA